MKEQAELTCENVKYTANMTTDLILSVLHKQKNTPYGAFFNKND